MNLKHALLPEPIGNTDYFYDIISLLAARNSFTKQAILLFKYIQKEQFNINYANTNTGFWQMFSNIQTNDTK